MSVLSALDLNPSTRDDPDAVPDLVLFGAKLDELRGKNVWEAERKVSMAAAALCTRARREWEAMEKHNIDLLRDNQNMKRKQTELEQEVAMLSRLANKNSEEPDKLITALEKNAELERQLLKSDRSAEPDEYSRRWRIALSLIKTVKEPPVDFASLMPLPTRGTRREITIASGRAAVAMYKRGRENDNGTTPPVRLWQRAVIGAHIDELCKGAGMTQNDAQVALNLANSTNERLKQFWQFVAAWPELKKRLQTGQVRASCNDFNALKPEDVPFIRPMVEAYWEVETHKRSKNRK